MTKKKTEEFPAEVVILVVLITLYNDTDCCFVVTVADPTKLQDFRGYRDRVLMKSIPGRIFIGSYYAGLGQFLAFLCLICPPIKWAAKIILDKIHSQIKEE